MNTNPLVSVVMPVFNTEKYVRAAIESVLAQTYAPVELICVDDGSSDGSLAALESFGERIRLVRCEKNGGIGEARNKGIERVTGELLAFLDADDLWEPEKLTRQVERLQVVNPPDILFSYMRCFLSPDLSDDVRRARECPSYPTPGYIAGTALMKTTFFHRVGLFYPRWRVGEFVDWLVRAKERGAHIELMSEVFLQRRIHGTNTGVTQRESLKDYTRVVREALNRKRHAHE